MKQLLVMLVVFFLSGCSVFPNTDGRTESKYGELQSRYNELHHYAVNNKCFSNNSSCVIENDKIFIVSGNLSVSNQKVEVIFYDDGIIQYVKRNNVIYYSSSQNAKHIKNNGVIVEAVNTL